jgi:hypothetical protein
MECQADTGFSGLSCTLLGYVYESAATDVQLEPVASMREYIDIHEVFQGNFTCNNSQSRSQAVRITVHWQ